MVDGVQRRLHGEDGEQRDQPDTEGMPPPGPPRGRRQRHPDDERQEDGRNWRHRMGVGVWRVMIVRAEREAEGGGDERQTGQPARPTA